jgi:hypothetical protein
VRTAHPTVFIRHDFRLRADYFANPTYPAKVAVIPAQAGIQIVYLIDF